MANIYEGKSTFAHNLLGWLENLSYRIGGINPDKEMHSREYLKALLIFNLFGFAALFLILITQQWLPFNPEKFRTVPWSLAFNISSSFVTNTNWQSYSGEDTLSYASQMFGLTVQNFLSAATGMTALLALIRGFIRKTTSTIGNFWVDLVRTIVYLLLPLSIMLSVFLISQGVIQTLSPYNKVSTLEGGEQVVPVGPVASQVAIKQIGTNGGGFFNANSSHPFENPSALTNFFELLAIFLIPAASVFMFGYMINSKKHGWLLFLAMFSLWIFSLAISLYSEFIPNPIMNAYPMLEGKETRFGIVESIIWGVSTTATSNGSVNGMLSSYSPLAGGVFLFNMMIGEVAFGGIGVGLCAMIKYVMLTVFIAGLMVGRTPEYLGKKIEKKEMQWVMLAILSPGVFILIGAGISVALPLVANNLLNDGPHGLSAILYAFTSSAANNGSSFAGLNTNNNYFNVVLGIIMILSRLAILVPSVTIGGLLARKKITPHSVGTFSVNTLLFIILLLSTILLVGALSFFPALSLGPLVEHLLMLEGRSF